MRMCCETIWSDHLPMVIPVGGRCLVMTPHFMRSEHRVRGVICREFPLTRGETMPLGQSTFRHQSLERPPLRGHRGGPNTERSGLPMPTREGEHLQRAVPSLAFELHPSHLPWKQVNNEASMVRVLVCGRLPRWEDKKLALTGSTPLLDRLAL